MKTKSGVEVCGCAAVHSDKVERAKAAQMPVSRLLGLGELFKVFADPTRIRILDVLAREELCVCDLTVTLEMTQSAVSHQLAVLKRARLVRYRKEGKTVFYALDDDHVREILAVASEHLSEGRASHGNA